MPTFFFCQVVEQTVTLLQVARGLPSPVMVIDAMPAAELAETPTLTLPFATAPFFGESIATLGAEAGIVTDTPDDWADVLPAASYAETA